MGRSEPRGEKEWELRIENTSYCCGEKGWVPSERLASDLKERKKCDKSNQFIPNELTICIIEP